MSGNGPMKRPRQDQVENPPSQEKVRLQCILDLCKQMQEIAKGFEQAAVASEQRAKAAEERLNRFVLHVNTSRASMFVSTKHSK